MQASTGDQIHQVAVFDLDGTCVRGQSGSLFTTYLFNHHLMSPGRVLALGWWGIRYKIHLPYRQAEARELVFGALKGFSPDDVDQIMRSFHAEVMEPKYRPDALAEIARRKEEGMVVLFASATFDVIAEAAAAAHGLDGYVATQMERDDRGYYTGQVSGPVIAGVDKYLAVTAWCDEHLGAGTWELACAYSDHYTDEDLLSHAKQAFAVCPGKTLKGIAKRRGWQILRWDE